jgi:hypothetical protein
MSKPSHPPPSDLTVSEPPRTRSGRVTKPPERYEPVEQVEDDYSPEDYDSVESDVESGVSYDESEIEEEGDDDLDGFVVSDKSESDDDDSDGEPPVPDPKPKRAVVKKRAA